MAYDPQCYDLADTFLSDEPELKSHENVDQLAQRIQDAIEQFIEEKKR